MLVRYATGIDRRDWDLFRTLLHRGLRGRLRRHRRLARRRRDHRVDGDDRTSRAATRCTASPTWRSARTATAVSRRAAYVDAHRPRPRRPHRRPGAWATTTTSSSRTERRLANRPPPLHDGAHVQPVPWRSGRRTDAGRRAAGRPARGPRDRGPGARSGRDAAPDAQHRDLRVGRALHGPSRGRPARRPGRHGLRRRPRHRARPRVRRGGRRPRPRLAGQFPLGTRVTAMPILLVDGGLGGTR